MRLTEVVNTKKVFVFKSHLAFHDEMPWCVWYFPSPDGIRRTVQRYKTWSRAMEFADFMARGGPKGSWE